MLIEKSVIYEKDFLSEFNKRFTNFSHKSPIKIIFTLYPKGVKIYEFFNEEKTFIKDFEFDFALTVKENISLIKTFLLEKVYPVMVEEIKSYENYSAEELNEKISKGEMSINDIGSLKEVKTEVNYRIEKIITLRDEIFVRNLSTNKSFRYKMEMPVTLFLKKLKESQDLEENFKFFERKSVVLNEIFDNYDEMKEEKV